MHVFKSSPAKSGYVYSDVKVFENYSLTFKKLGM